MCMRFCSPYPSSSSFPSSSHSPSFRPYLSPPLSPVRGIRSRGGRYIRVCEFMFECVCALVPPLSHTHTYSYTKHTPYPSSLSPTFSPYSSLFSTLSFSRPIYLQFVRKRHVVAGEYVHVNPYLDVYVLLFTLFRHRRPFRPPSTLPLSRPFLFSPLPSVRGIQLRDGR